MFNTYANQDVSSRGPIQRVSQCRQRVHMFYHRRITDVLRVTKDIYWLVDQSTSI
jgi:hypothetical protein